MQRESSKIGKTHKIKRKESSMYNACSLHVVAKSRKKWRKKIRKKRNKNERKMKNVKS